ncbi:MAG: tetratricopeptide repeat protein [Bacteroidia bacterium]|nr:tetratricopeptide repeat protein [Bacteroidia bacterium]
MIASSLVNIGTIYLRKGNYAKSLEYMFNALKLNEELGNKKLMASNLGNIGIIYTEQGYLEKAVQYQIRALNINEEINNKPEQAINLGNLGTVYLYQAELLLRNKKTVQSFKKYNLAFNCFQEALKINLEFDNLLGQANNYSNLGVILEIQGDSARGKGNNSLWQKKYFMAMKYYQKAMEINRKLNNQREMAANLANIAGLLFNQKKIVESLKYLEKAKKIYLDLNDIYNLEGIHSLFIEIFEQSGRFKDALIHFKEQIKYRDSIFNQENQKAAIQKELQYNFDKEQALKEKEHLKKIELEKKEKEKQRIVTLCIFAGLLSVLGFLGFVINRLHFTRKQKKIIEEQTHIVEMQKIIVEDQKKLVEQKNKDILDSINYAGKIQNAILPSPLKLKEHLSDFFVLYLPKDIVAGDFYWMEHYDKYVFLAVADCTGHGVPGAMVSVVCSNALTKAVLEEKQIETDQILNRTKELVIEKLTSEENIRDGMDVVLVRIEKGKNTIQFSGANRPLYIVDHELIFSEVKPDKQPIGYYEESGKFTKNEIELSKNSIIFLTTDGYADQFGGEKSKKLGTKKFKELLCDVARYHKTEEQKEKLISFLNKWKSAEEQIDDVTIIGIWL